jgi:hypothetical protein
MSSIPPESVLKMNEVVGGGGMIALGAANAGWTPWMAPPTCARIMNRTCKILNVLLTGRAVIVLNKLVIINFLL